MRNVIDACKRHGARFVFLDNVYAYGRVEGAMTEETPFNPNSRKGEVRARIATTLIHAMHDRDATLGLPDLIVPALQINLRAGRMPPEEGNGVSYLKIPVGAFAAGLGDHKIITTLCPGGKERMRRLMSVIAGGRIDLRPMVTHRFQLEQIEQAYDLFSSQRDGVLKVAITP